MKHRLGGLLISAMIVSIIIRGLMPGNLSGMLLALSGVAAWGAAVLLIGLTTTLLRIQISLLITAGLLLLYLGQSNGAEIDWTEVFSSNTALLTMIAAVGFLKLVALPDVGTQHKLPVGEKAFYSTLLSVSVFGSVINVSAPILIADRIHHERPLARFTSQSITRVFCAMSSWSPFFAAMAAVLTYVEFAELEWVILAGLPFALAGVLFTIADSRIRFRSEMSTFVGYPLRRSDLLIPGVLMTIVLLCRWLLPHLSILIVIALSALCLTVVLLIVRGGLISCQNKLKNHIFLALPRSINELILFLAAGVLAAGMSSLISAGMVSSPFSVFDGTTAGITLCCIVLCAVVGIHPIILISSFTPLILELNPNPSLLAATYLFSWNLGTAGCYLSGTHLVFQGRYGIPSIKAAWWNMPYVIVMLFIGCVWLYVLDRIALS
ncbi:MAG: hypothetical protein AAF402_07355 [Pseudomonadota bacterium]